MGEKRKNRAREEKERETTKKTGDEKKTKEEERSVCVCVCEGEGERRKRETEEKEVKGKVGKKQVRCGTVLQDARHATELLWEGQVGEIPRHDELVHLLSPHVAQAGLQHLRDVLVNT